MDPPPPPATVLVAVTSAATTPVLTADCSYAQHRKRGMEEAVVTAGHELQGGGVRDLQGGRPSTPEVRAWAGSEEFFWSEQLCIHDVHPPSHKKSNPMNQPRRLIARIRLFF